MKRIALTSFFLLILAAPSLFADTNITQNITQDTTWDILGSPYIIQDDIQVYPGVKLTVEPGVEVIIHVGSSLIIGGELIAKGEPSNLIIFNSNVTVPAANQPAGIIFESTAASAKFLGGFKPIFSYDHTNREVKLTYESGSIMEYCLISGLPKGLQLHSCYPYIANSRITGCPLGIRIFGNREIPIPQWFFLYHNTIENCSKQAMFVRLTPSKYSPFALFTGNIIQGNTDNDQEWALYISHFSDANFLFLYNNQVINNKGTGIVNNGTYTFLYADNNLIDANNQGLSASNAILLNNTITNNLCPQTWPHAKGAGAYLNGPRSVLFNNTIQANEICPGDKGDNIMLKSQQGNRFTIQYNNIGNSNGDSIDIYLDTDYQGVDCNTSKNMVVDATRNFWKNRDLNNLSNHIFDFTDDFCAGTVSYQPVLPTEMTPIALTPPPTLIAPEHNAFKPGTLTLNFSWQPVIGATKYLLCTNGWANIPSEAIRIIEVQGQTSAEITYSPYTDYAQKYIYWFVVAGNENGWSLPSEIRLVYFSSDPYLVSGKVIDENEIPVPEVYIKGEGEGVFSDDTGNYTLITRDFGLTGGITFSLRKEGYPVSYTFPRQGESFDTFSDLTIISKAGKDAIYDACGEVPDITKGTIAGIVVDQNDQALTGAEVFIEPSSGNIYYLNANNAPTFSSKTGSSGKFVILNVAPGSYKISADLAGYTFSPTIQVYADSITVDALAPSDAATNGGGGSGGAAGGGGGGGCFIAAAAYRSRMAQEGNILKNFPENALLTNLIGKVFVRKREFKISERDS